MLLQIVTQLAVELDLADMVGESCYDLDSDLDQTGLHGQNQL
jgi:hypothetical protein